MFKNRGCLVGIVVFAVLAILFFTGLDLYTDLVWFDALGLASILWKRIGAEWLLFLGGWVVATVVLGANWWLARRLAGGQQMTVPWLRQQRSQLGPGIRRTVAGQRQLHRASGRNIAQKDQGRLP